ncbi:MAG: hypothetical protein IPN68_09800 [Bacteroidetes bacterium]|nr:hypothetical protein [Bacteroidota bacterium]
MSNPLNDIFVMGVEGDTYKQLLDIAKKEGKTVNEVTADALKQKIDDSKLVTESNTKKLLLEG